MSEILPRNREKNPLCQKIRRHKFCRCHWYVLRSLPKLYNTTIDRSTQRFWKTWFSLDIYVWLALVTSHFLQVQVKSQVIFSMCKSSHKSSVSLTSRVRLESKSHDSSLQLCGCDTILIKCAKEVSIEKSCNNELCVGGLRKCRGDFLEWFQMEPWDFGMEEYAAFVGGTNLASSCAKNAFFQRHCLWERYSNFRNQ